MRLRDALETIGTQFANERTKPLAGNLLAAFIRGEAVQQVKQALGSSSEAMLVKGSPGQGVWAEVPWIACFYPIVTDTATQGFYVVYLFNVTDGTVSLSLNQGTTAVLSEFSGKRVFEVLHERAALMRSRVHDVATSFDTGPISLGSKGRMPRGYEAGHSLGRTYSISNLPTEEELIEDLRSICSVYLVLSHRGGLELSSGAGEDMEANERIESASVEEQKSYRSHRRIERNRRAAKIAKKGRPAVCQVCTFDFSKHYGELGAGYIEAHHLLPLSALTEGQAVTYKADDFALLCSNCHRMIHRLDDPSDLTGLQARIIDK